MSSYGTSSDSTPLFSGGGESVRFGRGAPVQSSAPLMSYGPNGGNNAGSGGGSYYGPPGTGRSGEGSRSLLGYNLNMHRIIIALGFFWVATVVYLASIGNSILRGMEGAESRIAAAGSGVVHNYRSTGKQQQQQDAPILGATYVSGSGSGSDGIPSSIVGTSDMTATDAEATSSAAAAALSTTMSKRKQSTLANVTIMVVYGPEYHHYISSFAWTVAEGVLSAFRTHRSAVTGQVLFGTTDNLTFWDVLNADAIIVGTPVYNGNTHPYVQQWINNWHIEADLSRKVGSAFVTAGGMHAGADGTLMSLLRSMMVFRMMAVGGDSWDSPFGAAATMHEEPFGDQVRTGDFPSGCYENTHGTIHAHFLRKAFGLGERVANVTFALANSTQWMKDKPSIARFRTTSGGSSSSYGGG